MGQPVHPGRDILTAALSSEEVTRSMRPDGSRRALTAMVATSICAAALSGCGGSTGDASVRIAQARVTAKQKAVTEATTAAHEAAAAFCAATSTFIVSLDRYGDVLNATAPTVGDVKNAGADLEEPHQAAIDGATTAAEARQELAAAEQELAQAQTTLTAAQGRTPPTTGSTSGDAAAPGGTSSSRSVAPRPCRTRRQSRQGGGVRVRHGAARHHRPDSAASGVPPAVQRRGRRPGALLSPVFSDAGCLTDEQQKKAPNQR